MELIDALRFSWLCLKLALKRTVKQMSVMKAIVAAILYVAVSIMAFQLNLLDWNAIVNETFIAVLYVAFPFAVLFFAALFYNLLVCPGSIFFKEKEATLNRDAEIASLKSNIEQLTDPKPDISIKELFAYINENIDLSVQYPEMSNEYPEAMTAKAIKDEISTGRLCMWGRGFDWVDALDDDYSGNVLKRLEFKDWDNFYFTFLWDEYDESIQLSGEAELARRVHAKYDDGVEVEREFLDLRFNRAQMESIWVSK